VFADWLEETGEPANVGWAKYIRWMSDCGRDFRGNDDRSEFDWRVSKYVGHIQARLTIRASLFVREYALLERLLPLESLTVWLHGFIPEEGARRLLAPQFAELYRVLPLAFHADALFVAMPDETRIGGAIED